MSEKPPRPPGSPHPTRQQLDELQALMEKMLALPVNQIDRDPVPVAPPLLDPGPGLLTVEEAPLPVEAAATTLPVSISDATTPLDHSSDLDRPPTVATGLRLVEPTAASESGSKALAPVGEWHALRRHSRSYANPLLWSLFWCNRVYDRWLARLGRPGRWLRGPTGRAVLGWLGLLCLAVALGVVIRDVMGWNR